MIRNVSKVRKLITVDRLKTLVNAIVISKIDYCNALLYGLSAYNINRLQILQNSAARVIYGKRKRDHVSEILAELHWLKVEPRIHFKVLCLVFKCIMALAPAYLSNLIVIKDPMKMILNIPRTHTAYGDRAYQTYGPRLWNALPYRLLDVYPWEPVCPVYY